jgi:hypothetical protein
MAAIRLALAGLASTPSLDADALWEMLRRASGIDAATAALSARVTEVRALRAGQLLDEFERIAARATPDDPGAAAEVEIFLHGPAAGDLGAHRPRLCGAGRAGPP